MLVFAPTATVYETPDRVTVVFNGSLARLVYLLMNAFFAAAVVHGLSATLGVTAVLIVVTIVFGGCSVIVLYGALGRESLELTRAGLTFTRTLFGIRRRRQFPLTVLGKFEFIESQSEAGCDSYLCFEHEYIPTCLAHDIGQEEGIRLAEYLNQKLTSMRSSERLG